MIKILPGFLMAALVAGGAMAATNSSSTQVTFNKDVLPILQNNCQECHRPGEVAPMSLLTYSETRPWAKAIKAAVETKQMPPWFADPKDGHFLNERILSHEQIATLASWADNGAPEGDAKDKPAPRTFREGWGINPDMVIHVPTTFSVPAKGTIEYQYVTVKTNFPEDMWVKAVEVRPGDRSVVHHMRVLVRPPGNRAMEKVEPGVYVPEAEATGTGDLEIIGKWEPGLDRLDFSLGDGAKFVPKGSDIIFNIHYTANGKATVDPGAKMGIVLSKEPPQRRYLTSGQLNDHKFVIPPFAPDVRSQSQIEVLQDGVELVWLQAHMHARGKAMEIRAIYPTGETQTLLKVNYDFGWQLGYELPKPISLPKGTKLLLFSQWDNSPNHKGNPDPSKEVRWGFQSWDEMSTGYLGVTVDRNADVTKIFSRPHAPSPDLPISAAK